MGDRERALENIIAIARAHALSAADIAAALGEATGAPGEHRWRAVIVRVLGVLGATFVFAGVGVFIALQWGSMNSAARVVITLGPGIAAFVLALLASRDTRFEKAAAPLFLMSAALQPSGMLVAFHEFGAGGDWRMASLVTCATMALQFGGTFAAMRQSTPLLACMVFGTLFFWTAFDLLDVDDTAVALVLGASMLLAAIGVDRAGYRAITPAWYLLGGAAFFYGFFDAVQRTPFEIGFLVAAAGFVYLSVVLQTRMLLFVATLAILAYTGWFTGQHFADSVGWPIALVVFGLLMIGLSALAFRIDREYFKARTEVGSGPQ